MAKQIIIFAFCVFTIVFTACKEKEMKNNYHVPDWSARKATLSNKDSLAFHKTYLPVYAQIYHISHETKVNLAATISIRNTDTEKKLFLKSINYFNTEGKLIRKYITEAVELKPCETIEIVIGANDNDGGTGANFIFEWASQDASKPLFESVMITTAGQQGIAFTCRGVDID